MILPTPKDGIGKAHILIELDLLTKQIRVSGHINDKLLCMNMISDAIRIIANRGTSVVETANGQNGKAN